MKYFVSKLVDGLEYLLGLGGMKRDIVFLIISGAALLLSLFDAPLPFSAAWVAIILCGVPIVTEAFIGIITKFDIKADHLSSSCCGSRWTRSSFFSARPSSSAFKRLPRGQLNRAPSRPFCCVQRQTPQRDIAQIAKLPMPSILRGKSPGPDL